MKAKDIYLEIEKEVFFQYRKQTKFTREKKLNQSAFNVTINRVLKKNKDTLINKTEHILNKLGYELCIRPIEQKENIDSNNIK